MTDDPQYIGTIQPGEGRDMEVRIPVPAGVVPAGASLVGASIELTGECACGGTLMRNPWRDQEWICSRSHWWNRSRHARLRVKIEKRITK